MATYHGEIIRVETGELDDNNYYAESTGEMLRLVRSLQPGDTLVINRDE